MSLNNAFVKASQKCKKSVVSVNVGIDRTTKERLKHLEDYLNRDGADFDADEYSQGGVGSGVIVSDQGHILTNHHVINKVNEDSILVTLWDGRRFFADVIGSDPSSDLALLRIYTTDLEPAKFADPESPQQGDLVLAVGSPLGLKFTVTSGIISAVNRDDWDGDDYSVKRFIQTDAAINPGNSGGGLFRINGELVGINTAILSRTGYNIGYGLALNTDLVLAVYDDLKENGLIERPSIGIKASSESFDSAMIFDRSRVEETVIVEKVKKGGAADRGGIQEGDIVRKINNVTLTRKSNVLQQMALYRPGQSIVIGVGRGGDTLDLEVVLDTMDVPFRQKDRRKKRKPFMGAALKNTAGGVAVTDLRRYGPLEHAGLKKGDVITSMNNTTTANKDALRSVVKGLSPGDTVKIQVQTDNGLENRTFILGATQGK